MINSSVLHIDQNAMRDYEQNRAKNVNHKFYHVYLHDHMDKLNGNEHNTSIMEKVGWFTRSLVNKPSKYSKFSDHVIVPKKISNN